MTSGCKDKEIMKIKFVASAKFLSYIICMRQDALNLKQENIQNPVQCFKLETGKYTESSSVL